MLGRSFMAAATPIITGTIGVIFAMILKVLYDRGIIIDEVISDTITLSDLMLATILVFFVFGVVIAALQRR